MTDPVAERNAGVMAAADALMDAVIGREWRKLPSFVRYRDTAYTALLSERQRGREEAADLIETLSPPGGVGLPGADVPQQAPYRRRTDMTKNIVGRLAGRFLTWKLPADFNPDGGVTFTPEYQNPSGPAKHEPTGTNLLTYAQAVTMVEHMLADLIESLSPPDGVGLPFERDTLGRMVREAWVRWAQTQPNPKPSFLAPYDDLSEADKEADRQIGEAIAKWTMIGVSAQANSPAASPPDGVGLTRYDKVGNEYDETTFMAVAPAGEWVRYEDAAAALAAKDAQIALDAETRTKMTLTIHEAWKALGIENYNGSDTRTLPEAIAERDRWIADLEAGLETADSWLMLHARHVGSCLGKSLCTCGLTLVRAETGALLSGQQDPSGADG